MGFEKQIALALLVVVFVAFSCASPTAQSEPTWVDSGYVKSGECKVSRSSAKLLIIISIDLYNIIHIYIFFFSGLQCLHVQVYCQSAVLSGRLTSELHTVCRDKS